jgi:hypothetical protein
MKFKGNVPDIQRFWNGDIEVSANRSSALSTDLVTKPVQRNLQSAELLAEIKLQVTCVLNRLIVNTLMLSNI